MKTRNRAKRFIREAKVRLSRLRAAAEHFVGIPVPVEYELMDECTPVFLQAYDNKERQYEEQCSACTTPHCCRQYVQIYGDEALRIANLITKENPVKGAVFVEAVKEWAEWFYNLTAEQQTDEREFFKLQRPCPFLVDNKCGIYSHRPAVCRAHFLLDPKGPHCCSLEAAIEAGPDGLQVAADPQLIISNTYFPDNPQVYGPLGLFVAAVIKKDRRYTHLLSNISAFFRKKVRIEAIKEEQKKGTTEKKDPLHVTIGRIRVPLTTQTVIPEDT